MTTSPAWLRLARAESRPRTRDLLISAAMRVLARDGYARASVDAIAEDAGFTVGAVYSNFATKQELFLAVFEAHCEGELADLRALAQAARGRDELLAAVTARFADPGQEHRDWQLLAEELWLYAQRHPEAAERLAAVQAEAREVIAAALGRDGEPLSGELAALVHALWAGFVRYRMTDPAALGAAAFGRAVGWLIDGQKMTGTKGPRR